MTLEPDDDAFYSALNKLRDLYNRIAGASVVQSGLVACGIGAEVVLDLTGPLPVLIVNGVAETASVEAVDLLNRSTEALAFATSIIESQNAEIARLTGDKKPGDVETSTSQAELKAKLEEAMRTAGPAAPQNTTSTVELGMTLEEVMARVFGKGPIAGA